jgi:hypothetical protein
MVVREQVCDDAASIEARPAAVSIPSRHIDIVTNIPLTVGSQLSSTITGCWAR